MRTGSVKYADASCHVIIPSPTEFATFIILLLRLHHLPLTYMTKVSYMCIATARLPVVMICKYRYELRSGGGCMLYLLELEYVLAY